MVEFDYTPRVAQETAGLGFVLPLPQRQQGIDVRNANPQTRASQAASMPFYQQAEDIDPTLTNLRDSYIADVQGLNALVQEAVSLGYDPRTIDYQDPQSIEVNKRYREMLEPIKQKEAQLRYAKPVTTRMRQLGQLYDPSIEDVSALQGFGGAEDVSKAYNQSLTSMGYGQEGLNAANIARKAAQDNIKAIYQPYMDKFANNPVLAQSLNTMLQRDLSTMEQALPKAPPKPQRDPIADFQLREEIKLKMESNKAYNSAIKDMTITPVSNNLFVKGKDGKKVRDIGARYSAPLTKTMEPASVDAKYYGKGTAPERRKNLDNFKYDSMEIVGIDKDGNVIEDSNTPVSQYDRFEVVMKGSAKPPVGGRIAVYDIYGNVVRGLSNEEQEAYKDINEVLGQQAQVMTRALKGGASVPATKPAAKKKEEEFDPNDPL